VFKKNTAVTGFVFGLVSATDGSAITSDTVTGYYLLDGGTQGTVTGSPVHEGNGQWSVNLLAAEMNGDVVGLIFTHTSAINASFTIKTTTKLVSELNDVAATDIVSSGAITTSGGAVSNVTTVATTTTNTDMRGTDSALLAASAPSNFGDLSITASTGLVDITQAAADKAWGTTTRVLTANTNLNDPTAATIADAVWDEALSGHTTGGTAGKAVLQTKEGTVSVESTVNDASATTTSFVTALTEATSSHYSNVSLVFIDGTLVGQSRPILSYDGTTKTITLEEALTEAPANGDGFIIKTDHVHPISEITADMDANSTQLAAIVADTNELQTDITNGGRVDLLIDGIKAKTDSLTFTLAGDVDANIQSIGDVTDTLDRIERAVKGNVLCTVGSGSSATSIVTSACDPAGVNADQFKGRILTFAKDTTTTALRGQATDITASTAASTPVLTVSTMVASPVSGDTFTIT